MPPPDSLTVEAHPASKDVQFLEDRINEFNVARTGIRDGGLLSIFVRDDAGAILAGLYGWTWGGACEVRFLWVREDARGQGYGKRLLQAAEREAAARGCRHVVLSTHTFQAPGFYQKLGYQVAGAFDEYPLGYQQIFLEKKLGGSMDKEKLENLLDELHAELDRADSVDEEYRAALRQSAKEIRERLGRGEGNDADSSVLERLNAAVVQFEGTHPRLALAITQVINALVDIGV